MHDCLTFSAIGMAVRHNFSNVRPILKDTGHFYRQIAGRYFKTCLRKKNAIFVEFFAPKLPDWRKLIAANDVFHCFVHQKWLR